MQKIKTQNILIFALILLVIGNIFITIQQKPIVQAESKPKPNFELNWQNRDFTQLQSIEKLLPLLMGGSKKKVSVKSNSILELRLNKPIYERKSENTFGDILKNPLMPSNAGIGLIEIKKNIQKAKKDKKIKGILLNLDNVQAGFATLTEIRTALLNFKKSDKFIIAYGKYYSETAYLLASVADEIILNPLGSVEWNGMVIERMFYTGAMEKLGVKAEIFRVGEYKSAVEPFMRKSMSEESKEQAKSFMGAIYEDFLNKIARSRNLSKDTLRKMANQFLVRNAQNALDYQLVTKIAYFDEVEDLIKEKIEVEKSTELRLVNLKDYAGSPDPITEEPKENKIAVIIADGEIQNGTGYGQNVITDEAMVEALRMAKNDKSVKAIVLRINSPGGSALASDIIWREIQLCKKVKPVVASMSDVAASGGYYLAMASDKIVAHPSTITGSIGVFGMLLNTQNLFENKLGLYTDRIKTGEYADLGNPNRSMSETEKEFIQEMVEDTYATFTSKAAKGRNLDLDSLKNLAGGRVWSGYQAKKIGLIDELGSLEDAVTMAAKMAKIKTDSYDILYLPEPKDFLEEFLDNFSFFAELPEIKRMYAFWKKVEEMDKVQARMDFEITFR